MLKSFTTPADLEAMLDDDVTYWILGSTPVSGLRRGKTNVLNFFASEAPLFRKPLTFKVNDTYVGPDWFIIEFEGDSITRAGDRYQNTYCMIVKVKRGKIVALRNYVDTELARNVMCKGIRHMDDVARLPPVNESE
jgi:hypothetical protein